MKRFVYWLFTIPFMLSFGFILCVFHVLQVVSIQFGYEAHNKVVNAMSFSINANLIWLLSWVKFKNLSGDLPLDKPMIIISNHQSMFDITAICWLLRKHHPKFISKKSLAFGIPSVSYNIRNGGSIYIDRNNKDEALKKIEAFNQYLNDNNRAGVIFPEGTRTKDGKLLPFKTKGALQMLSDMPEATVVPIVMQGYWNLEKYKLKPVPIGNSLSCTALAAIDRSGKSNEEVLQLAEKNIQMFYNSSNS